MTDVEIWLKFQCINYGLDQVIRDAHNKYADPQAWQDYAWKGAKAALEKWDEVMSRVSNGSHWGGEMQIDCSRKGIHAKTFIGKTYPDCYEVDVSWSEVKRILQTILDEHPKGLRIVPGIPNKQITFRDIFGEAFKEGL